MGTRATPLTMVGKAARLTKEVLEAHYHLPMAVVAKKFSVCLTYFKKLCRQHGIMRWPYRQVASFGRRQTQDTDQYRGKMQRNMASCHLDFLAGSAIAHSSDADSDDTTSWRSDSENFQ